MKFTISKNYLSNQLQIVDHAISSTSVQPSLRGIFIDVDDQNNQLILTGSDGDISIRKQIQANEGNQLNIIEGGQLLIDSRYLIDIVKKLDADIVSIELMDGALTEFTGMNAHFKINGMNPADYPAIDFSQPSVTYELEKAVLASIIEQTTFATVQDNSMSVLTGVLFSLKNHTLTCVSSDSYRLAKKSIPFDSDDEFTILIPARSLNEVRSTLLQDLSGTITLSQDHRKASFYDGETLLQTRLLDGSYPTIENLIPTEFQYELTIGREDLIRAIDRTTFLKTDNITINTLSCKEGEVILTNHSQEIGESREVLNAEFKGEPLTISFSGAYVMSAAKTLKGNTITIGFNGDMKPFVMKSVDDPTVIQLVLPVRSYH